VEDRIARLLRIAETDEGFFVLALHSFVEAYIREECLEARAAETFPEILRVFGSHLRAQGAPRPEDLETLNRIAREHWLTRQVRHAFKPLDRGEVLAATYNFLRFCEFRGIRSPGLLKLRPALDAWEEKRSPVEKGGDLSELRDGLREAQHHATLFLEQLDDSARDCPETEVRDADVLGFSAPLGAYFEGLNRLTLYTRTRRDYERSLMRLTGDQQSTVDSAARGHDFLVRGGAGTGKTSVLIHALARVVREKAGSLPMQGPSRTVFLASSDTMVRFDRFLARILGAEHAARLMVAVDSFFLSRLRAIRPRSRIDGAFFTRNAGRLNTTGFFSDVELSLELEDFLFGNAVTREEYLENRVLRRGMRQPLSAKQREIVWAIRTLAVEMMEGEDALSRNWSRIVLIEHLERNPRETRLRDIDFAFVDESQDLASVDLKALKLMTSRGLIIAGDTGATLSPLGSPFRRAGIDISGRTRILRTNFRSTRPIMEFAERYRALCGGERDGEEQPPRAFREGPMPELHLCGSREEMMRLLARKVSLFIDLLGYAPEDITVLVPAEDDLAMVGETMNSRGRMTADIGSERYTFVQEKTVRLSTLDSCKGTECPVVLLCLPTFPAPNAREGTPVDFPASHLIFQALTTATDALACFVAEDPREQPLRDLISAFRGCL